MTFTNRKIIVFLFMVGALLSISVCTAKAEEETQEIKTSHPTARIYSNYCKNIQWLNAEHVPLSAKKQLSRFAGQEVVVFEEQEETTHNGETQTYNVFKLQKPQSLTTDMQKIVKEHNFTLRLTMPNEAVTMDYLMNRLNNTITQDDDKKWRIGCRFSIG